MRKTTLCYIRKNDQWLMLYRNRKEQDPNEGKWVGIGGGIEPGESPDQCLRREVLEETGLRLGSAHFHGIIRFRSDSWEDEDMYLYSTDDFEGKLREDCDEGELAWIETDRIFDLPMWEGDRAFLQKIFDGEDRIFMTLRYEGESCRIEEE